MGGVVHFRESHNGSVKVPFMLCEDWDLFMKFLMGTKDPQNPRLAQKASG